MYDARMKKMPEQQQDLVEFVFGNMLFVGFHELGHALVERLNLPVLGRVEAAADSFATLALLEEGSEFSVNVLVEAARGWFLIDRRDRERGSISPKRLQQRAFQIVCLMVDSDPKQFKELATGLLPAKLSPRLPDRQIFLGLPISRAGWRTKRLDCGRRFSAG
jgi:hypothetical protein